jgi:hypothetical protein
LPCRGCDTAKYFNFWEENLLKQINLLITRITLVSLDFITNYFESLFSVRGISGYAAVRIDCNEVKQ